MLGLGQWVEDYNLIMLGVQVLSNRASGYCSLASLSLSLPPLSLSLPLLSLLRSPLNALHSLLVY